MINFNTPLFIGKEIEYIQDAVKRKNISGNGYYTKKCCKLMEDAFRAKCILLTTSCTHALEMAALLLDIEEGDEVIMPSFTFVSTANAFVLRGAKIVFVDIRPDTLNMDENLIECAITDKTKAIVPVHYAGVSCEMDKINQIAKAFHLSVIEDAAQGIMSLYKRKALGTLGDIGCFSFHETKNYTMGEGGAILVNKEEYIERAEIIKEKGTDRSKFLNGYIDKYTWVDLGSSYLPSELNAAYLYAQLEEMDRVNKERLYLWDLYYQLLKPLMDEGVIELPFIPDGCSHNAHMFYIKTKNAEDRKELINHLKKREIASVFHYVPLHQSKAGKLYGRFHGEDRFTTTESERLLRLPLFFDLSEEDVYYITKNIADYYKKEY